MQIICIQNTQVSGTIRRIKHINVEKKCVGGGGVMAPIDPQVQPCINGIKMLKAH